MAPELTEQTPYPTRRGPAAEVLAALFDASHALEAADVRSALRHATRASVAESKARQAGDHAAQIDRWNEADSQELVRALLEQWNALSEARELEDYDRELGRDYIEIDTAKLSARQSQSSEALEVAILNATRRQPPSLGTTETPLEPRQRFRRELYRLQDFWRKHTDSQRTHVCGRTPVTRSINDPLFDRGAEIVQRPDGRMSYANLVRCRSRACPPCAVTRAAKHGREIERVADFWRSLYGTDPLMLTLTVRHGWDDDLGVTGKGVRLCWRLMLQGRRWQQIRKRYGLEYISGRHVTHGQHGWHPHLHTILLTTRKLSRREQRALALICFRRWSRIVRRELGTAYEPLKHSRSQWKGLRLTACKDPAYITRLALELTDTATKEAKGGNRTPITLLADAAAGEPYARELYSHYETELRGTRDLTWSSGARWARWQLEQSIEAEDEEYKQQSTTIATLAAEDWDRIVAFPGARASILESAERGRLWLDLGALIGRAPWSETLTERRLGARAPPDD